VADLCSKTRCPSTHFHKYSNVCDGEGEARPRKEEESMQVASSTTKDKGIARLPRRPSGWGETNAISLLFLLADGPASTRRRASIWHSSRSQHTSPYLWKGVLSHPNRTPFRRLSDGEVDQVIPRVISRTLSLHAEPKQYRNRICKQGSPHFQETGR